MLSTVSISFLCSEEWLTANKAGIEFFGQAFFLRKIVDNKAPILVGSLETDESAVTSLPFRLTVSYILFALFLPLSSISIYNFLDEINRKIVFDEVWTKINPKQLVGFEDFI